MDNPRIYKNGTKEWYNSNGRLHRNDGPAVVHVDGGKSWYQHGKVHRADGPAYEDEDGYKTWWLNDNPLTFDEWLDKVKMSDEDKVMMKLQYG
jgi:hypothetical protein